MYTITLGDGSKIENLRRNGTNYVSDTEITEDMFTDKLSTVTITDGEITNSYTDMKVLYIQKHGSEYWFNFGQISESERLERTITELQTAMAEMFEQIAGGL